MQLGVGDIAGATDQIQVYGGNITDMYNNNTFVWHQAELEGTKQSGLCFGIGIIGTIVYFAIFYWVMYSSEPFFAEKTKSTSLCKSRRFKEALPLTWYPLIYRVLLFLVTVSLTKCKAGKAFFMTVTALCCIMAPIALMYLPFLKPKAFLEKCQKPNIFCGEPHARNVNQIIPRSKATFCWVMLAILLSMITIALGPGLANQSWLDGMESVNEC